MDFNLLDHEYANAGGTLIILVGPPGSGKSSFAKEISEHINNYVVVSPDIIRKELFGDPHIQRHNNEVFSRVYSDIIKYLDQGYNVIYDATNCRSIHRLKIINRCKDHTYRIICFIASTSLSDCFKQNAFRDKAVPEEVIEKMYLNLKKNPPNIFEGYDLIAKF